MKTSFLQSALLVVLALIILFYLICVWFIASDFLFCEGGGAAGCGVTSFFILPITIIFGFVTLVIVKICKQAKEKAVLSNSDTLIIKNWSQLTFLFSLLFKIIVIPPIALVVFGFVFVTLANLTLFF